MFGYRPACGNAAVGLKPVILLQLANIINGHLFAREVTGELDETMNIPDKRPPGRWSRVVLLPHGRSIKMVVKVVAMPVGRPGMD